MIKQDRTCFGILHSSHCLRLSIPNILHKVILWMCCSTRVMHLSSECAWLSRFLTHIAGLLAIYSTLFTHGEGAMFNPRRTCARVTVVVVCVCLSVCPSVTAASVRTWNQRYSWVSSWILTRGFSKKTSVQKLWREKANMLFSHTFGINEGQNLPEAQLVGQVLLERLATGAHRHKTGHCLPATTHRASYAHAQYTSVLQSEPEPNSAEDFVL